MPRVPLLNSRELVPEASLEVFDEIIASRGRITPTFGVMLHSPELSRRVAHLGTLIRFESSLPVPVREMAALTAAHIGKCAYEWGAHQASSREHGISEAAIETLLQERAVDGLNEIEALVIRYGRQLLRDHVVDEETFEAARARFGEQGVIDLSATIGYYSMVGCVLNATGVGAP